MEILLEKLSDIQEDEAHEGGNETDDGKKKKKPRLPSSKKPRLSPCPDSDGDRSIEGDGDDLVWDSTERGRHVTAELCAEVQSPACHCDASRALSSLTHALCSRGSS